MVQAENRETLPPLHIEVTAPRIALPPLPGRELPQASADDVQVRLLYEDRQGDGPQSIISTEVTTHRSRRSPFRLFHLRPAPVRIRQALLQVLCPLSGRDRGQMGLRDELALMLEVRSPDPARSTGLTNVELTPGLQSVVVFLNEEGRPQGFSVDGAQD